MMVSFFKNMLKFECEASNAVGLEKKTRKLFYKRKNTCLEFLALLSSPIVGLSVGKNFSLFVGQCNPTKFEYKLPRFSSLISKIYIGSVNFIQFKKKSFEVCLDKFSHNEFQQF